MMDRPDRVAKIAALISEDIDAKKRFMRSEPGVIADIVGMIVDGVRSGNKVIVFGNGGSASDSQHIAAELIGRFKKERPAIPAISLTANTSSLTALGNDYGYDVVFKRQLEGIAKPGDIAIGISTSGNSQNIYLALEAAKRSGLKTVAMTGRDGGKLLGLADLTLKAPSVNTPRIQEVHITAAHIICELVEDELYK
jgi:D-sedoheptulose 7-phosphate isomerase